jgi:hypothetical protein
VDWIELAQSRIKWLAFVNMVNKSSSFIKNRISWPVE